MSSRNEDDPEFVEAKHAEIQRDVAAGNGAKHFEDLLDSLHSNPSQQHNVEEQEESAADRDARERAFAELSRAFLNRLRTMLNTGEADGILVTDIKRNVGGRGFLVYAKDKWGRFFEAGCDFETMGVEMALNPRDAFQKACDLLASQLREERAKYMRRAGLS